MNVNDQLESQPAAVPAGRAPLAHGQMHAVAKVEIIISTILRGGVIISMAIILFGMTMTVVHHHAEFADRAALKSNTSKDARFAHSVPGVIAGARDLQGQSIITIGLLFLIATPVIRVAASIVAFAVQKDGTFVAITCVVLTLLILSFVLGRSTE